MKIEQLLVQHLYKTKELTLHGIGRFLLDPGVVLPIENDKDFSMPEKAISFEYDLKTVEDGSLVDFITQQTGKIKPLASADLDSYVILAKQFLNIGKPLTIEGIGTVQKNQVGDYEFAAGTFITPKIDDIPRQLREKRDESVSFGSESKKVKSKTGLLIAFIILILLIAGLGIYYLLFYKKPQPEPIAVKPVTIDTIAATKPDSNAIKIVPVADSNNFNVVIKEFASAIAAKKELERLTSYGHKVSVSTKDSVTFKLYMPFKRQLADTLMVKDSLRKFFGGTPYINTP